MSDRTMTADEAKTFGGYSIGNAMVLAMAAKARGCDCQPYKDWFTYRRWRAQGCQVQKGEHGVKLSVFVKTERKDKDAAGNDVTTTDSFPWMTTVFCRHQVMKMDA